MTADRSVEDLLRLFRMRERAINVNSGFQVMQTEVLIADTAMTARGRILMHALLQLGYQN